MKLFEIKPVDLLRVPDDKHIGAGIQGMAFAKTHNNSVIKVYGFNNDTDAYHQFITEITKLNNPYFPRIYRHKTYNKPINVGIWDYNKTGVVEMERLVPLSSSKLDNGVVLGMLERIGITGKDVPEEGAKEWFETHFPRDKNQLALLAQKSTDNQFKAAVDLIIGMHGRLDAHGDNWMVRLTSVGPQLVILDPVIDNT